MDEEQIRNIVREEMHKEYTSGSPKVPPHTHNGSDNLQIVPPFFTFCGFVPYADDQTLESIMPGGWSVEYTSTGVYRVIHNLFDQFNVSLYSIVATAQQSTNAVVVPVITAFDNSAYVSWFDSATQLATATSFSFVLSTGNNATLAKSQYVSRNVL